MKFYVDFIRLNQIIKKNKNNIIRHLRLKIHKSLKKNWNAYKGFNDLTFVKKYLRKLNNIQRAEYKEKFKTFIFKTTFSAKKSIITIISKTHIITTLIKPITPILFVRVKVDIDVKELMCYNCNQIEHIKRDCF